MTHICVSKLTTIGSDNGLSPGWRQAIIWTNDGMLLIEPLGTTFSEILSEIHTFSFKKMHLITSSGKWWPSCLGLNVLNSYSKPPICWLQHNDFGNIARPLMTNPPHVLYIPTWAWILTDLNTEWALLCNLCRPRLTNAHCHWYH